VTEFEQRVLHLLEEQVQAQRLQAVELLSLNERLARIEPKYAKPARITCRLAHEVSHH
jgi:hypothetical protein